MANNEQEIAIIDSRFQSFYKCFIIDVLKADIRKYNELRVVKIKNLYVSKVCVTGIVVSIYEAPKYLRIKIDDSTGKINVTIWKEQIYNPPMNTVTRMEIENENNDTNINDTIFGGHNTTIREDLNETKKLLSAINKRANDDSTYTRPTQGDLVSIKGYVKCYRDLIEINSLYCTQIKNSNEEYFEMIMPIILSQKCYELNAPTKLMLNKKQEFLNTNKENKDVSSDEKFQNFVLTKLIQLTSLAPQSSLSLTSTTTNQNNTVRQPCSSYSLFTHIREKCNEYKTITHKNVIDALKQLEVKCMIYSCDNDNSYLPIN